MRGSLRFSVIAATGLATFAIGLCDAVSAAAAGGATEDRWSVADGSPDRQADAAALAEEVEEESPAEDEGKVHFHGGAAGGLSADDRGGPLAPAAPLCPGRSCGRLACARAPPAVR